MPPLRAGMRVARARNIHPSTFTSANKHNSSFVCGTGRGRPVRWTGRARARGAAGLGSISDAPAAHLSPLDSGYACRVRGGALDGAAPGVQCRRKARKARPKERWLAVPQGSCVEAGGAFALVAAATGRAGTALGRIGPEAPLSVLLQCIRRAAQPPHPGTGGARGARRCGHSVKCRSSASPHLAREERGRGGSFRRNGAVRGRWSPARRQIFIARVWGLVRGR